MPRRNPDRPRGRPLARPRNNTSYHGPPPGVKGREIGLYYKNLNIKKKKLSEDKLIHLRIPEMVIMDIYKYLEKIENIAMTKNIYMPPAKKLEFIPPPQNVNYIPIKVADSEIIGHQISNIRKRDDDDVVFVKSIDPNVEIVDLVDDITDLTSDTEINAQSPKSPMEIKEEKGIVKEENDETKEYDIQIKEEHVEIREVKVEFENENVNNIKREIKDENEEVSCNFYFDINPSTSDFGNTNIREETSEEDKDINTLTLNYKPSTSSDRRETDDLEVTGYLVSNNYTSNRSSESASKKSNQYKYSYDDIITSTFQEKLDECITNGIEITKTTHEVLHLNRTLKESHESMIKNNAHYKQMLEFRQTLPTYKRASELLDVIDRNQVVVISGETGCGKSTQVPQLILDNALKSGRGANVNILVTEPRRIAASSLAARVAEERGERIGTSVGYCVRLESVSCRERGSIKYCTTGVLLVELEQNQALSEYSHVILDEVHERDCQIDIAMCMLKQVLSKRKDLKLILMSATIDADTLSTYYDHCPMFHIEGLAYPVRDVYMEEILEMTKFKLPPKPNFVREPKVWHKYAYKHKNAVHEIEKEIKYRASIESWMRSFNKYSPNFIEQLTDHRIEELNLDLVLELLRHICKEPPGAILVFLPGISEISKLMSKMRDSYAFPETVYEIYALHSKLPTIDQKKIFERPPNGVRKIIVATNIAETSITIDDVVYVVDCGKMKYKGLDVEKNLATLQNEWISKANLRQRRGRAGRCQPGVCYHLITTFRAEMLLDRLLPELQRSNLLEEVLCIKKLRLGMAEEALKMMPVVPAEKTIQTAIRHLQQVGALDEKETLTPMGWHLARLPVPPAAGKLLVLGALFGCLDRAASVAAVWGFKDPFQLVIGKEAEVDQIKRQFALGEPSDHVAISQAIIEWERSDNKWAFARRNFLSHKTLELLSSMKSQFASNLKEMGFLSRPDTRSSWENRNEKNLSLFKAIVAAALYPNIATVRWRICRNPNKPISIKAYTPEDGKVSMHPSSVMHTKEYGRGRGGNKQPICRTTGANWLVYGLKQKSSDLFLLDVTCVYTLPLLFFGDLNFTRSDQIDECLISISSYKVYCKRETAQLLYRLRSLLDQVLTFRIGLAGEDSKKRIDFDEQVLSAVIDLITAEDEGTQYLGEDDDDDNYFEPIQPEDQMKPSTS